MYSLDSTRGILFIPRKHLHRLMRTSISVEEKCTISWTFALTKVHCTLLNNYFQTTNLRLMFQIIQYN